jgi:hypothetical protein
MSCMIKTSLWIGLIGVALAAALAAAFGSTDPALIEINGESIRVSHFGLTHGLAAFGATTLVLLVVLLVVPVSIVSAIVLAALAVVAAVAVALLAVLAAVAVVCSPLILLAALVWLVFRPARKGPLTDPARPRNSPGATIGR